MFSTNIQFNIVKLKQQSVKLYYSKWNGKIEVYIDDKNSISTSIVFGGEKRQYLLSSDGNNNDVLIEIYPGKAFWVTPLI